MSKRYELRCWISGEALGTVFSSDDRNEAWRAAQSLACSELVRVYVDGDLWFMLGPNTAVTGGALSGLADQLSDAS